MANLYREVYGDIKESKEAVENEVKRIDKRFDYLYDKRTMDNRVKDPKLDLQNKDKPKFEDEYFAEESTDLDLLEGGALSHLPII